MILEFWIEAVHDPCYRLVMRMSEGVEWGMHSVALLAALPAGAAMPGKALAEFHGVSESYLLKHLKALAAAGILESIPGPKGGYRLARPAEAISFLDVAEAIEGPEPAFRCTEIRRRGPVGVSPDACKVPCAIHATMREAEAAWRDVLRKKTIADLVAQLATTLDPDRVQQAIVWIGARVR